MRHGIKKKCEEVRQYRLEPSNLNYGIVTPVQKGKIVDKSIKVLVRELDAKEKEKDAVKGIIKEK